MPKPIVGSTREREPEDITEQVWLKICGAFGYRVSFEETVTSVENTHGFRWTHKPGEYISDDLVRTKTTITYTKIE
ncbi:MAG: hypothetical protein WC069_02975 [Candidatus Shapirobacteria bacterium]